MRGKGWAAACCTAAVAVLGVAAPAGVADGHSPVGDPRSYRLVYATDPVTGRQVQERRDPCLVVSYRVSGGSLGSGGVAEWRAAVARLARETGISLRYLGTTTYVPRGNAVPVGSTTYYDFDHREMERRTGATLVVAFATPSQSNLYRNVDGKAGVGGFYAERTTQRHPHRITHAYALVNPSLPGLKGGHGRGQTRGSLMLHELGHAFGLDHVGDRLMVMHPELTRSSYGEYNNGDLAGLRKVGRPAGCMTYPAR